MYLEGDFQTEFGILAVQKIILPGDQKQNTWYTINFKPNQPKFTVAQLQASLGGVAIVSPHDSKLCIIS